MEQKKLTEKVIWITGSGRGIGKATAISLATHGARVVVSARTKKEIEAVVSKIKSHHGNALAIECDVSDKSQIIYLVKQVKEKWGPIDILINNAGIGIFKKIITTEENEWDAMMDINLKSAFLCTQAVLQDMINKGSGHIINVVSVAGKQPYYNCGGYCASKYGLLGFTDVLRMETRKHGIKVTAFLPGATDTAIWGNANVERAKMMTPIQVAECVVSICAGDAKSMTEEVVLRPAEGDL